MTAQRRIVVAGAGSIGCFVGGVLALAGRDVTLLARPRTVDELRAHGLRLSDLAGLDARVAPDAIHVTDDPAVLASAALVLVTVKSGDTAAMADLIARHAPPAATVVSLQNGVANASTLRARLTGRTVLAGMVPFNVVRPEPGRFHRATTGSIVVEASRTDVAARLGVPHLPIEARDDMDAVLWGKLLFNLNNALNALSGLPLRDQLKSRAWRLILAAQIAEALAALRVAKISPHIIGPLPAHLLPFVLRLPTALYRLIAAQSLRIDPAARSSMAEDLGRGRKTEIDELQGAVIDLARRSGRDAPVNRAVLAAVRRAEVVGAGSPGLRPQDLVSQFSART